VLGATLWAVTPPWPDLLLDLHAAADARLDDLMPRLDLARALALLVLAEIERGNEAGVHIAHEPMMAFEKSPPPAAWQARVSALLRGTLALPPRHSHERREPIRKALAVITARTRRVDLPAVLAVVGLLTESPTPSTGPRDAGLEALRAELDGVGVRLVRIEGDQLYFEQHGQAHSPVRTRQLGEMLYEIRQAWLH